MYGRILNASNETVRMFDVEPRCGKDFCDDCGDCLACRPEECRNGHDFHIWVDYESNTELIAYIDKESEPT